MLKIYAFKPLALTQWPGTLKTYKPKKSELKPRYMKI